MEKHVPVFNYLIAKIFKYIQRKVIIKIEKSRVIEKLTMEYCPNIAMYCKYFSEKGVEIPHVCTPPAPNSLPCIIPLYKLVCNLVYLKLKELPVISF